MPKHWFLCPALVTLRNQINATNPNRDKTSDGSVGDTSHKARKSDHNPGPEGEVKAIDIDEDLSPSVHSAESLVKALQASQDPRILYIIYEKRITVKGDITRWKPYTGINPHNHHFHISVRPEKVFWNDASAWDLTRTLASPVTVSPAVNPVAVTYRKGDKGAAIKEIQKRLIHYGFLAPNGVDGDFGNKTETAVIGFQKANGLTPNGVIDKATKDRLF